MRELVARAVVEGEQHGVEAEAAPDPRDDRLKQGIQDQVLFQLVGDFEDLVQRLGALVILLGELLNLRADSKVALGDDRDSPILRRRSRWPPR